ncbi:DUF6382 domain-containing protein [Paenibacillus sp. UNC499MF]|uniref:DUF6382 domain-containing protein n=1 Tax=Paenibacillus sp. UNC499MF TaxID=1502751 RepID=UPI00089FA249|nr:DUF6382 domain-containing protein [Paenibacillus sp. UNC499MF]SEG04802.1 FHA domain-containing protein [Paenibacillus sp. UNC499MF]
MERFGLQASMRLSQGRWLEVGLEEGLTFELLTPLQLKMIQEYPIPGVLPLKTEEIGGQLKLLYELGSRRSLASILKEHSPDLAGCLQLLHEAAACVSDSGNFMLNEAQFLVDKNYIYMDRSWADVSLLCFPLKEIPAAFTSGSWGALVRDLSSRLMGKERGRLARLAEFCEREDFSVRDFKRRVYLEISENKESFRTDGWKGGEQLERLIRSSAFPESGIQNPADFDEREDRKLSVSTNAERNIPETEPLQFHRQNNKAGGGHLPRDSEHMPHDRSGSAHRIAHESRIERKPPRGAAKKFIQSRQQLTAGGEDHRVMTASGCAGLTQPVSPENVVSAGGSGGAVSASFAKGSTAAAGAALTCFSASGAAVAPSGSEAIPSHTVASHRAVTRTAPPPTAAATTAAAPNVPPPAGAAAPAGPLRGSRGKILALGGAFLIIGMIWNAYFSAPGTPLLYISSGATLLALDAAYILLAVGLPGRRISHTKEAAPSGSSLYPPAAEQEPVSLEQYYARLGERTTLLAPPLSAVTSADETVFLGVESAPPSPKFRHPVLEVMREGRKETILLDTDSFIIGRAEGDADYIEDVLGISRIHAQFLRTPEGYAVKDLGSRNGTFLNDGMLVPYQMVALKDGDVVRMIYTEFSFRSC